MRWDFIQIIMLLLMIYSQIEMVTFVYLKHKDKYPNLLSFYNYCSIYDYIRISREEKGRIGGWFWVFALSAFALVVAVINGMVSESEFGDGIRMKQDDIWPIL